MLNPPKKLCWRHIWWRTRECSSTRDRSTKQREFWHSKLDSIFAYEGWNLNSDLADLEKQVEAENEHGKAELWGLINWSKRWVEEWLYCLFLHLYPVLFCIHSFHFKHVYHSPWPPNKKHNMIVSSWSTNILTKLSLCRLERCVSMHLQHVWPLSCCISQLVWAVLTQMMWFLLPKSMPSEYNIERGKRERKLHGATSCRRGYMLHLCTLFL